MALWGRMSRIVGEWICIYTPATSTENQVVMRKIL